MDRLWTLKIQGREETEQIFESDPEVGEMFDTVIEHGNDEEDPWEDVTAIYEQIIAEQRAGQEQVPLVDLSTQPIKR